jgi:hypothetical protein
MTDWLRRHRVAYDVSISKANMFAATEMLKLKNKVFKVDNMLHAHSHTTLRTPPYMCYLKPTELAQANIKHYVRSETWRHFTTIAFQLWCPREPGRAEIERGTPTFGLH